MNGVQRYFAAFAIAVLALLALSGAAVADVTFSDSSVSPSTLRPGVSGTATFTVTNTGTSTVGGLSFDISGYGFELPVKKVVVGDIGAGGSTQVTVPFRIRSDVPAGIYSLQASTLLSISSTTSSTTGIVSRTFTIPITVSDPATFEVTSTADKAQVSPGGDVSMKLTIRNNGGSASNMRISAGSTSFLLKGASQLSMGELNAGESAEVDVTFTVSSSLSGGTYAIPLKITYEDDLGRTVEDTADVGPIRVVKSEADFGLRASTSKSVYPGDKFGLSLDITNNGGDSAYSAIVSIAGDKKSGEHFVALDSADRGAGDIAPGSTANVEFEMGVNGDTPPGFYALNATITYVSAQGETTRVSKLFGLEVLGRYDVSVIAEPSPSPVEAGKVYSLSVQISNIGSGDLKAVSAELSQNDAIELIGTPYGFIGELEQGDYSSASYNVYVKPGVAPGRYPLSVNVTFVDAYNAEHRVTKQAYLDVVSPELAAIASGTATGPSFLSIVINLAIIGAVLWYANKKGWLEGPKALAHKHIRNFRNRK